jgi:hypothetical protein
MSTCRLSFQWASTIHIQWSVLFWYKADLMIISSKCNMFLPWYILTSYSLGVKEHHSLTQLDFELFWRCITVYFLLFTASNWSSTICFYTIVLLIILVFCVEFFILLVFFYDFCAQFSLCPWIVHYWLPLRFSLAFAIMNIAFVITDVQWMIICLFHWNM